MFLALFNESINCCSPLISKPVKYLIKDCKSKLTVWRWLVADSTIVNDFPINVSFFLQLMRLRSEISTLLSSIVNFRFKPLSDFRFGLSITHQFLILARTCSFPSRYQDNFSSIYIVLLNGWSCEIKHFSSLLLSLHLRRKDWHGNFVNWISFNQRSSSLCEA